MKERILRMVKNNAEAKREKALTSLQLLLENPVGIGDHSTDDFYNNVEESFQNLVDADDTLETLKKYDWGDISEIN
jgi:hypothetical protein